MSEEHRGMTNSTSSHSPTVQGLVELGLPKREDLSIAGRGGAVFVT
jgi:hypothetical protein